MQRETSLPPRASGGDDDDVSVTSRVSGGRQSGVEVRLLYARGGGGEAAREAIQRGVETLETREAQCSSEAHRALLLKTIANANGEQVRAVQH
jgi:hypothetical protein